MENICPTGERVRKTFDFATSWRGTHDSIYTKNNATSRK
jgi:hypothetical protein